MRRRTRHAIAALLAVVLCCTAVGTVAAAPASVTADGQPQTADVTPPAFVVALAEDGSAEVTVTYTFDLTDDARQAAFEELRDNETAAQSFEDRFRVQLQGVASDAGNATGREMSITDVDVAFETDGETGIVWLTATWDGLAGVDGEQLTVTEPFASGFEPERTFAVVLPEGYTVDSVTPEPESSDDSDGDGGTDGDDGTASDDDASNGESGPGFGPVVAVLAVLGVALLVARRQ